MTGRSHGDASGKIEEFIAIHIFDHNAAAAPCNQRIRACVGWGNVLLIDREDALGVRAGKRSLELGADGQTFGGHGVLQISSQFPVLSSQWFWGRISSSVHGEKLPGLKAKSQKLRVKAISEATRGKKVSRCQRDWRAHAKATRTGTGGDTAAPPSHKPRKTQRNHPNAIQPPASTL